MLLTEVADSEYDTAIATEAYVSELQQLLAEPCVIGPHTLYISASIGIALYPNDTDSVDDLLKHADVAMYRAKQQGRNTSQFYLPSMQESANKRLLLEKEMREAIRHSLFDVHYQPQLDSKHHLIGAEALVRWQHPEQGFISPAEFIPVAEETGLILEIGDYVLRCACRLMKRMEQEGARDGHFAHIAVNVSAKQFMQHNFVEQVLTILSEEQVSTGDIELEITEGVLLHDVNEAIRKMVALREAGIYFSIDDFGTGYSSLSYLSKLPIDKLKIDQSFVRHMGKDPADAAIVETIIAMTRHLGIDVIAEGVETEQELNLLQQQGCHKFQGYHFSRPLAEEAFIGFVRQRQ
jgi:EAL domain-containing protein (putative c-di-GMP-specific phosphodiesterase class I)